MKKLIVTVVVIVAILGIAFAFTSNSNTKNSINTPNNPTTSTSSGKVDVTVKNTTTNTESTQSTQSNHISPAEAQKIAMNYIEVSGATAGTPKLQNQDGTLVYIVPVIDKNNKTLGEIDIDAKTGKNLGGAGGAP